MEGEPIRYCGWDIGGAHLKFAAISAGGELLAVEQFKCPLWLGIEHLFKVIDLLHNKYPIRKARHAVTMTGELCDSFGDRITGVREIVSGISEKLDKENCLLYGLENNWQRLDAESIRWQEIASANWYASARFTTRHFDNAIVVDFGSTTVDVIPIAHKRVVSQAYDDFSRLKHRELVYTGMVRTPVSAIVQSLPFGDSLIPVAAESFATSADVYRVLQLLPENADLYEASDGGHKTTLGSARRLFRMIGRDYEGEQDIAESMAACVKRAQFDQIARSLEIVADTHDFDNNVPLIGLGCGAHLVRQIAGELGYCYSAFDGMVKQKNVSGKERLSAAVCAPAVAVALELLAEQLPIEKG